MKRDRKRGGAKEAKLDGRTTQREREKKENKPTKS